MKNYSKMFDDLNAVMRGLHVIHQQHNSLPAQRALGTTRKLTKQMRMHISAIENEMKLEAFEKAEEDRMVREAQEALRMAASETLEETKEPV